MTAVGRRRLIEQPLALDVAATERALAVAPGLQPSQGRCDLPELPLGTPPGGQAIGDLVGQLRLDGRPELSELASEPLGDPGAIRRGEGVESQGLVLRIVVHAEVRYRRDHTLVKKYLTSVHPGSTPQATMPRSRPRARVDEGAPALGELDLDGSFRGGVHRPATEGSLDGGPH
jgi:hypothetical protein